MVPLSPGLELSIPYIFCNFYLGCSGPESQYFFSRSQTPRPPTIKVGTHWATSWSNMSRRHVAATNCFVGIGVFLSKSSSLRQNLVATTCHKKPNQTKFVRLVVAQNSVAIIRDKIFTIILQYTLLKRFVAPQRVAACTYGVICRCDLLLQLVA